MAEVKLNPKITETADGLGVLQDPKGKADRLDKNEVLAVDGDTDLAKVKEWLGKHGIDHINIGARFKPIREYLRHIWADVGKIQKLTSKAGLSLTPGLSIDDVMQMLRIRDVPSDFFQLVSKYTPGGSRHGVTKGGNFRHGDVIAVMGEKLKAYANHARVVTAEEAKETLFLALKTQLGSRLKPEDEPIYRREFNRYIDTALIQLTGPLTVDRVLTELYTEVLNFKEEIDIPEKGEAKNDDALVSVRKTAQGPYATTCGVHAVLSLFESLGYLPKFQESYNTRTYGQLDHSTFEIMLPFTSGGAMRRQGMSVNAMPKMAASIAQKLGAKELSFQWEQIHDVRQLPEFTQQNPQGFVGGITTKVGPHAVHVINYNSTSKTISYYDPIGLDGSEGHVIAIPLQEFNGIFLADYGVLVAKKISAQ